jgi:VWFA-related protein
MAMLSHRQGCWLAAVLAFFPCVFFASDTSDTPPPTFRAGTSEVRISFFATDENNRPVEKLTADDFAIVDSENVIRNFRSLNRSQETALNLVILMDASESVGPHFSRIQANVSRLAKEEQTAFPTQHVAIVTFSGLKPVLLCDGNCSLPMIQSQVSRMPSGGVTPLFDALVFASKLLARNTPAEVRPILILFSDGNDTVSMRSARDATDAAMSSGASLYAVGLSEPGRLTSGLPLIEAMAEATGGRFLAQQDNTTNVLETILADLRASYVVTYQLPNRVPGYHSLRLLPKHNLNLRFHSRRGYVYEDRP